MTGGEAGAPLPRHRVNVLPRGAYRDLHCECGWTIRGLEESAVEHFRSRHELEGRPPASRHLPGSGLEWVDSRD